MKASKLMFSPGSSNKAALPLKEQVHSLGVAAGSWPMLEACVSSVAPFIIFGLRKYDVAILALILSRLAYYSVLYVAFEKHLEASVGPTCGSQGWITGPPLY